MFHSHENGFFMLQVKCDQVFIRFTFKAMFALIVLLNANIITLLFHLFVYFREKHHWLKKGSAFRGAITQIRKWEMKINRERYEGHLWSGIEGQGDTGERRAFWARTEYSVGRASQSFM